MTRNAPSYAQYKIGDRYDIPFGYGRPKCEGYVDDICLMEGSWTYIIHFYDHEGNQHVTTRSI